MASHIKSFRDLVVWQKAKKFAVLIYKATANFPKEETYGLTNQLRRAAVAIASNIAEGFNRRSVKEKIQFLRIAYGSGSEVEAQLEISKELSYLSPEAYVNLNRELVEIMKIINVVINKL